MNHTAVIHEFGHALLCVLHEVPVLSLSAESGSAHCRHATPDDPRLGLEIAVAGAAMLSAFEQRPGGVADFGGENDLLEARRLAAVVDPEADPQAVVDHAFRRLRRWFLGNMPTLKTLLPEVFVTLAEHGEIDGPILYDALARARGYLSAVDVSA